LISSIRSETLDSFEIVRYKTKHAVAKTVGENWVAPVTVDPSKKLCSVLLRGTTRKHLTPYVPGEGSGRKALCGKSLELKPASAELIEGPDGTECRGCLKAGGFSYKRMPRPQKSEEEIRLKAYKHTLALIPETHSDEEKLVARRQAAEFMNKLYPKKRK
jgi:hypothetical protein